MTDLRIQLPLTQRAQPATMGDVVDLLNVMYREIRKYRVRLAKNLGRIERLEQQIRGEDGGHRVEQLEQQTGVGHEQAT